MRRNIEDSPDPDPRARKRGTVKRYLLLAAIVACLTALASLAACSDNPGTPRPQATATATETPTEPAVGGTPEPLPAALQEILQQVAEVRGLEAPADLKASLVSRADLPALLEDLITDEDREWFRQTTTLYRLLGHFTPDQDYLTIYEGFGASAVLGLYSPAHKQLWVVHEGQDIDFDTLPRSQKETLAHELVHALQDEHFDLEASYEDVMNNLDREQAWTSVVEGDAVTHEQLYGQRYLSIPLGAGGGRLFLVADLAQITDVPPSIARELIFPYTTGAEWIRTIVAEEGAEAVDEMLQNPPLGTAYVLHPELRGEGWEPRDVTLPDLSGALGEGWERESGGTIGEFGWRNYLQLRTRAGEAGAAAAGWAGDAYEVYVEGEESVAVFRISFMDPAEAQAFAQAQQSFITAARAGTEQKGAIQFATFRTGYVTATTEVSGSEVLFAIGSSREVAERAIEALAGG